MFDFLKKSRAVKFLCSACLLCSLGSFAVSAAGTPAKIADVYVQAELGNVAGKIALVDATMDTAGILGGTLKLQKDGGSYEDITNADEDAKITLFLAASDANSFSNQLAVSESMSLFQKDYTLNNVQFYASSGTAKLGDAKEEGKGNYAPSLGKFSVWGIVSDPGSKSLISGPKTSS